MAVSTLFAPLTLTQGPVQYCQSLTAPTSRTYSLDHLVSDIKAHLGQFSGIGCVNVDEAYLISLAKKYMSNPNDWTRFYYNCPGKNYTRNTISNINEKANILLLVWNPGKGSPIHDHANAHCIMKVLAGELTETVYEYPKKKTGDGNDDGPGALRLKSVTTHRMDQVTYITDDIGLHRVHNPSADRVAVSLHLYTPPNAADIGYNIFDESTGKACFVPKAASHATTEGNQTGITK